MKLAAPAASLLSHVRPSRSNTARDLPALESAMQGLALPGTTIALEIAATARRRSFFLRAEMAPALRHLERQIQARYPQAVIGPAEHDPWYLAADEECSLVELCPGTTRDLPLRSLKVRELLEEGADPLLGILAACGDVVGQERVVAQLALTPLPPTWSASFRRRAVEHPLEPERIRQRQQSGSSPAPSGRQVVVLFVLVGVVLLLARFHQMVSKALPAWVLAAGQAALHGHNPHLDSLQQIQLLVGGVALVALVLVVGLGLLLLVGRFGRTSIYDQRLVEEKTRRAAYRARLRLVVIGSGERWPIVRTPSSWHVRWQRVLVRWRHWRTLGWSLSFQAACHRERARWRGGRRRWSARLMRRRQREQAVQMLIGAYTQYHLAAGGFFLPRRLFGRRKHRLLQDRVGWIRQRAGWASDVAGSSHILSVADIAALWHLPQAQDLAEVAYLEQAVMRTLPAPPVLSRIEGYLLGESTHAGRHDPVFFPLACLQQNMLAVASTGKGKSTLFAHLMQALALARLSNAPEAQGGALLIDPHGDLAATVAGCLPAALLDDIVFLDLADQTFPVGFNVLDMSSGQDIDKSVDNLIQIIEALWPTSYGPRTENFLEYGCKTLASANQAFLALDPEHGPNQQFTLLDLVSLFRQESFRHAVFEYVQDQRILDWWNNYYEQLDGKQQADFTSSLITKISKFASSKLSRCILGQAHSSLDFGDLIRQKKLILLSCSSGEIGADLAALFGSLLVGFFHITLAEQARFRVEDRQRFLILIDEFQTLKVNYQTMLAELRKYGGSFALATQSLAYLDRFERTLRATVLANVEHLFAFAMADEDARLLRFPGVEPEDVQHLPNFTCYARFSLAGERLPVFSMQLTPPLAPSDAQRQDLLNRCQMRYGRPLGLVEQGLKESEARQKSMRPTKRKGAKGYEVIWSGTGEERVQDTLNRLRERDRGMGGKKTGTTHGETDETVAQHTMYEPGETLANEPDVSEEGGHDGE